MIPHVYEMALKQNPQSEELYSHLFMAYVRIGDYKKQQQVRTDPVHHLGKSNIDVADSFCFQLLFISS